MQFLTVLQAWIILLGYGVYASSHVGAPIPVYGFQGASQALASGHTLHYTISLDKCKMTSGPDQPEFVDTFGGHAITYRTFNDREMPGTPFVVFHDQKLVYSEIEGKLARLTRSIQVFHNDTAEVTSEVYSADWSKMNLMYSHECTLSIPDNVGDVQFQSSDSAVTELLSFEDLVEALEQGRYVHVNAMTFICQGGRESSFSTFGGHVENYELRIDGDKVGVLRTSLQSVVHHDPTQAAHFLDVMHLRFHSNTTVEIVDSRATPPSLNPVHDHISYCRLSTGAPGGSVHVYAIS